MTITGKFSESNVRLSSKKKIISQLPSLSDAERQPPTVIACSIQFFVLMQCMLSRLFNNNGITNGTECTGHSLR